MRLKFSNMFYKDGRVWIKVHGKWIKRARYIMSCVLGRPLLPSEKVHHKNEIKDDDTPDNLELMSNAHHSSHHQKGRMRTEEAKRKQSEIMTGRMCTKETKLKMSKAQKGKTFSDESIKKMSESAKNKNVWWRGL